MKLYEKKIINGKLLQIKIEINNSNDKNNSNNSNNKTDNNKIIQDIQILGDFFMHPEEKIKLIENKLIGKHKNEVLACIDKIIRSEKIQILGFDVVDLYKLICRGFDDK